MAPPTRELSYRPEIDGLRAVAVLAVMLFHARIPYVSGGYIGVDIFFVISGYLISRILWCEVISGHSSLTKFYERRARRILPALFVMLALSSALACMLLSPPALMDFGGHVLSNSLFVANILFWLQSGYFAAKAEYTALMHTWSLSVEEQFYLLFPLLLILGCKVGRWFVVASVLVIAALSLQLAQHLTQSSVHADAAFYLLPTRTWELLVGSLLAIHHPSLARYLPHCPRSVSLLAASGLAACLVAIFVFDNTTRHPGYATLLPVLGSVFVIAFGTRETATGRLLAIGPLVAIGLISYSVYLFHQPILAFSRIALARDLQMWEAMALLVCALALGAVSWHWVEQPFRSSKRVSPRSIALLAGIGFSATATIGGALTASYGAWGSIDGRVTAFLNTVASGSRERDKGIGLARCHYNAKLVPDLENFLDRWDCLPANVRPRVLVVGDSISADKAWVLREAGFSVGNLGGAGCQLTPPASTGEPCRAILVKARELFAKKKVDGIVLARNWQGPIDDAELQSIVTYWSEPGAQILVFSGMPNFDDFKNRATKNIRNGLPLEGIAYDENAYAAHERSMAAFVSAGFTVVNSRDLFCRERPKPCSAVQNGAPLVGDGVHLQPAGARLMASRIKNDQAWLGWYRSLSRE